MQAPRTRGGVGCASSPVDGVCLIRQQDDAILAWPAEHLIRGSTRTGCVGDWVAQRVHGPPELTGPRGRVGESVCPLRAQALSVFRIVQRDTADAANVAWVNS